VKMKIGSDPDHDPVRVGIAREAIGPDAELFVDANGAYARKQALALAARFREDARVSWFEEPVSSDDLDGLRLIRDRDLEYFHDRVRIEQMLLDDVVSPADGALLPDRDRPGMGLELKRRDAEHYAA
jgi:Enolase C-terminal domain-like